MARFLRFLRPQAVPGPVDRTQTVTYDDVWVSDDGTPDLTQVVTYSDSWVADDGTPDLTQVVTYDDVWTVSVA